VPGREYIFLYHLLLTQLNIVANTHANHSYSLNVSLEAGTIDRALIIDNEGEEYLSVTTLPDHALTFTLPDPLIGVTLLIYTDDTSISLSYNAEKTSNETGSAASTIALPTATNNGAGTGQTGTGMKVRVGEGWGIGMGLMMLAGVAGGCVVL
jgi:hypothetical protein